MALDIQLDPDQAASLDDVSAVTMGYAHDLL